MTRKKFIIATILSAVLVGAGVGGTVWFQSTQQAAADTKEPAKSQPLFSFTGVEGWRKGPSNDTSMALFSQAREDGTSPCFVSVEYRSGSVDSSLEINKTKDSLTKDGYTATSHEPRVVNMQTGSGELQYELHQYKVESPSGSVEVYGGQQLAYHQLTEGHLKVIGNCETSEQLAMTIPALEAIRLETAK